MHTDVQCFEIVPFFQCAYNIHEALVNSERFPMQAVGWVDCIGNVKNGSNDCDSLISYKNTERYKYIFF